MSERFTAVFEGRADGVKFEHLSKPLAECVAIHAGDMTAEIERLRAALAAERERCARKCEGSYDSEMRAYGIVFAGMIRED